MPSECGSGCAPRGAAPWRLQRERRQPAAPVLQLRPSLQGGCRSPESPPIGSPAALGPPLSTTATAKPPADTTHLFNQTERLHPPHSVVASEKQGPRRAPHPGSAAILGTELVKSLLQIPTPAFLSEKNRYLFPPLLRSHSPAFLLQTKSSLKLRLPILRAALSPPSKHIFLYPTDSAVPFLSTLLLYWKERKQKPTKLCIAMRSSPLFSLLLLPEAAAALRTPYY